MRNLLSMRWPDINLDRKLWIIAGEESKNGRPQSVALTGPELVIVTRPGWRFCVFTSPPVWAKEITQQTAA